MDLRKCIWGLTVLVAVSSCTEKMDLVNGQSEKTVITAISGRHTAPASSRSSVGDIAGDGSLVMQWTPGDQIGVFGDETANACFTSTNTALADQADFSGNLQSGDTPRSAYYPYDASVADRTAIAVEIPASQDYADASSVARYDFKAATIESSGSGYSLHFRQMATLLRLKIDLHDASGLLAEETLQSITMTLPEGNALTGSFSYSLDNLDAGLTAASASPSLTIKMANPPKMSEQLTAYAVVAPGAHQGKTAKFVLTTDKHEVTFSTELLTDFDAGVFYDLPLTAEVLTNNNAVVEELPDPDNPVTEETANCYMITTTGEHSFLATQIGNGDKGIIPGAGFHVTTAAISPKSAKLLWQDTENFVSGVDLQADGRVHYTANGNVGNAVIAVYSEADCTGDILWSWHIWGVGDALPSDEEYTNRAGATFTVMDRTLGAHGLNSYYATLYQWGRKDPIPNSTTYYVDGAAKDIETSYPVYADDYATLLTAVQHPGELINRPSANNQNWLPDVNNYLWGDINNLKAYAGYKWPDWLDGITLEENQGWTDVKTIYDPSPVGYRVANKFTWTGFVDGNKATNESVSGSVKLEKIKYVKYENGYYFMKNADDATGSYYPMTGSRGAATGTLWVGGNSPYSTLNYTASYWSSSPQVNAGQAHCLSMTPYDAANTGTNSWNVVSAQGYAYTANAFAVRCVKE